MTKSMVAWVVTVLCAGSLFCGSAAGQADKAKLKLQVKETSMGKLSNTGDTRSISVSPDGQHVAILTKKGEKYVVVRDGVAGKEYDWVVASSLTFTADSQHVAYVVQQNNKMFVVVDTKEGKQYHEIVNSDIFMPREGASVAYCAKASNTGKRFYVINEEAGKEYDQVFAFSFSPDGKRWAYGVESGGKQFFIVDGVPTKEYDKVAAATFTWGPDSKRIAYVAVSGEKVVAVVDGKEETTCDETSRLFFSPDGKHLAYMARTGEKTAVVLDGKPLKQHERVVGDSLRFSPDGARLAYMASRKDKIKDKEGKERTVDMLYYVVDGEDLRMYPGMARNSLLFSPDSKRVAYVAVNMSGRAVVVIDGIEGKEYEDIRLLQFSPDSKRIAYLAMRDKRAYAVVDNAEGLGYVTVANLMFSKDSKRMAYVAQREKNMFVVVDGKEGENYAAIVPETLSFSPDGQHVACQALKNEKAAVFVIDGVETPEFAGTLRGTVPVFDSPTALRALVLRNDEVFKMQVTISE